MDHQPDGKQKKALGDPDDLTCQCGFSVWCSHSEPKCLLFNKINLIEVHGTIENSLSKGEKFHRVHSNECYLSGMSEQCIHLLKAY